MNVLLVLVPCSLVLGLLALLAFVWTIRSEQYNDLEGDAMRILGDAEDGPNEDAGQREIAENARVSKG